MNAARIILSFIAAAACAATPFTTYSQAFPSKPIRLIVPSPPGGPTDIFGRVLGQKMSQELGQPILVENRPGAGGTIGAEVAAKSPGDGYTLFFGTSGTHGSAPALYPKLAYDPVKSFTPISLLINAPLVVVANASVPAGSLKELIAFAKSNPGKLSYGSGNISGNIIGEMFKIQAGIDMLHVPYKGAAPAAADLIAGRVQMMFDIHTTFTAFLTTGKIKPLAITGPKRLERLPGVPSSAEAGLPGFDFSVWFAMFAPRGVPKDVLQRLNHEVLKALATKEVKDVFAKQGMEPAGGSPEQLAALMAVDIPKWTRAVQASGAKID
jgi:tripartite-type tricarboxylate transporter receptor subunit TctC